MEPRFASALLEGPPAREAGIEVVRRETKRLVAEIDELDRQYQALLRVVRSGYEARVAIKFNERLGAFVREELLDLVKDQVRDELIKMVVKEAFQDFGPTSANIEPPLLVAEISMLAMRVWAKSEELAAQIEEGVELREATRILLTEIMPALPEMEAILIQNQADHEIAERIERELQKSVEELRRAYEQLQRRSRELRPEKEI